jgi:pimeloyl-ACP methyl ester carboxylesterase
MEYRRDEVGFESGGYTCRAWLYRPSVDGDKPPERPCIVMAHGMALTRTAGLDRYARKFVAAGHMVLVFDYRHFGDSDGEPRELLSVRRQLRDWASAIRHARSLPGVDPARIALWGTSFSGGHVITAAARDGKIAAVSAQGPMMDALAGMPQTMRNAGFANFLWFGVLGMLDQLRAILGMAPVYVPVVAKPGQLAVLCSADAEPGYRAITPPDWRNHICARFALVGALYRPIVHAGKLRCPTLIQVCMQDRVVSASAAVATAHRIGNHAELRKYDCGHFDIYGEQFERAMGEQLAFFERALLKARAT